MKNFNEQEKIMLQEKIAKWWTATIAEAVKAGVWHSCSKFYREFDGGVHVDVYVYSTGKVDLDVYRMEGEECPNCGTSWDCWESCTRRKVDIPFTTFVKYLVEDHFNKLVEDENRRIAEQLSVFG